MGPARDRTQPQHMVMGGAVSAALPVFSWRRSPTLSLWRASDSNITNKPFTSWNVNYLLTSDEMNVVAYLIKNLNMFRMLKKIKQ